MAESHPWEEAEKNVREALAARLADYLALTRECEAVAIRLLEASGQTASPGPSQVLRRVHATLIGRVLRDLRACDHLASLGYTMQAYTLASSCMEAAYLLGFIADNEERADRWVRLTMDQHFPWRVRQLIEGTAKYLGWGETPSEQKALIDYEFGTVYRTLCAAKHIHAAPERNRYWRRVDAGSIFRPTPQANDQVVREAQRALCSVVRVAAIGLSVLRCVHLTTTDDFSDALDALAERADNLLARIVAQMPSTEADST